MDIKYNVPLAKHTSYKVGGCAKIYFKPRSFSELTEFMQQLSNQEDLLWLGLGSNILVRDGGFDGVVIHTYNNLNELKIINRTEAGILLRVEAGVSCAKLAKFCIEHNLEEGIWFAGIPGTIGGALNMNAGAFGGDTWTHVRSVEVIDRLGKVSQKSPGSYQIGYRSVVPIDYKSYGQEWFIAANLFFNYSLIKNQKDNYLEEKLQALFKDRKSTQPIGTLNCGSVFKNPPNNWAGKLIEDTNLKGKQLGDAIVSPKHANFIINMGAATASDIEELIKFIQAEVFAKHGVILETEVKIVGKF